MAGVYILFILYSSSYSVQQIQRQHLSGIWLLWARPGRAVEQHQCEVHSGGDQEGHADAAKWTVLYPQKQGTPSLKRLKLKMTSRRWCFAFNSNFALSWSRFFTEIWKPPTFSSREMASSSWRTLAWPEPSAWPKTAREIATPTAWSHCGIDLQSCCWVRDGDKDERSKSVHFTLHTKLTGFLVSQLPSSKNDTNWFF